MTATTTAPQAKTIYRVAQTLTTSYLITALVLSFTHIAALFALMGAGWEAWIAPVMIDMVAIIGKISTSTQFTRTTRQAGKRALVVAGSISLLANVTVGYVHEQYGSAILGAIVVFGALWAESHLHNLRPVSIKVKTPAAPAAAPTAKVKDPARVAAAKKAAATRAARKDAALTAAQAIPAQQDKVPATRYI